MIHTGYYFAKHSESKEQRNIWKIMTEQVDESDDRDDPGHTQSTTGP